MNIYLFDDEKIITFSLPAKKIGNFWMKDFDGKNIVNITVKDNNWLLNPSKNTKIYVKSGATSDIPLNAKKYYIIEKNDKKYFLYCDYLNDNTFLNYEVKDNQVIKVGNSAESNINIPLSNINKNHIEISYQNKQWQLRIIDNSICYLNDKKVTNSQIKCNNGDLINIYGIKMLLACNYIFVNNPFNNIVITGLDHIDLLMDDSIIDEEIENEPYYKDEDYFLKSPRIRKSIETFVMKIDSPPAKEKLDDTPLWAILAPMMTMAASSTITISNAITSYLDKEKTFKQILPTLIISGCMLFTMLIWPFITRKFQKKQKEEKEKERQNKYQEYINKKEKELVIEYENQKRTLEENLLATDICYDMIINKRRTLWSRRNDHKDFLSVRVGKGDADFDTNITYQSEDFTMDNDNLKMMLDKLINSNKIIADVPIRYSLKENILTCINGIYPKYISFVNNLLLQVMSFHSYDDLKIAVFTNEKNKDRWKYLMNTPYCFSDDKTIRFFATNTEEMQEVSNYLEQIYNSRAMVKNKDEGTFFNGYYLMIIDDIDASRKIEIVNSVLENKSNNGFSAIILEEKLSKVPSEVSSFLIIGEKTSTILNATNNLQKKFTEEIVEIYDMDLCARTLSNLPIYMEEERKQLPNNVTFLELFGVGKVEQLNVLNKWKTNNPTKSLKAEVGINVAGDPFILDLHEKFHGPHGLIAGMTGSGKSEFIITYVLSMAVNYSPEEVSFVLIDYKGGGLAGAFVNSETGKKLPHVVGTITNLDKSEINRALSSIKSELRRRQEIFNEVRTNLGEGTIDIYKYQRLYRDGVIKDPIPHLVIVCDEFAELKSQRPEFMDDLISTARIGRSLGVHLILATQKPSGVVDAQIWSNSKFKVCLKVQDKEDSNEMIRNDLAAELKNVGRFYLLVGYSEYFSTGQAAWAGAQYYPNNEYKKAVDKNIYLIDNIGSVSKTINNAISKRKMVASGEEIVNIVKYIIGIGEESNLNIKKLWLDRIPNEIFIEDLVKKYNYQKEDYVINPIIGEYDNPTTQTQGLLTLPISNEGNTLIYGMGESGKDEFLQSIMYNLISNHNSDEVNIYAIDFGSETLINFSDAPQVGDVVLSTEEEKLINLVRLLNTELARRKKLFTKYNGNYKDYLRLSGEKLPNIVVIINSIEVINELYFEFIDKFVPTIREGAKYGIYYIITTENQNSIKLRISQCCKQVLCLQLSNEASYKDILGKTDGITPSSNLGRGLVRKDIVCEFQTAYIASSDNVLNIERELIDKINTQNMKKATQVPVMPEIVDITKFVKKYIGMNSVPVGIAKESLVSTVYDFKKKVTTIISSNEMDNMKSFIYNFVNVLKYNNNFNKVIIDASNFFDEFTPGERMSYINSDFTRVISSINTANTKIKETLTQNNMDLKSINTLPDIFCVIVGFEKFYSKLSDEDKKIFIEVLKDNKETSKISFAFMDIPASFKKYEYDEWYKNSVNPNDGIWIGQGLAQQFVLKAVMQAASFSNIENDQAVVLKNGVPTLIKLINEIKINK